jgi:hypothetical protein
LRRFRYRGEAFLFGRLQARDDPAPNLKTLAGGAFGRTAS